MGNPVLAAARDVPLAARAARSTAAPIAARAISSKAISNRSIRARCCGEKLGYIRADDGPTWLTLLIVGHVVVALALVAVASTDWSTGFSMAFFSTLAVVMSLALLPSAKGIFIGIIWAQKLAKSEDA